MLILFDQAVPMPLRPYLEGHTVHSAFEQGWDKLRNGDLLAAAERAGYDVLITTDKSMSYQQNLGGRNISVVILGRQQWPELRPHVQIVIDGLAAARPGSFVKIDIPPPKPIKN
jgi:sorbitol-specific phosphotransferase system component IIA